METNPFDLTPEQKSLLVTLARETGKPIPALLAEALEGLQAHVHPAHAPDAHPETSADAVLPPAACKPIWERFEAASRTTPDTELDRLPTDLATQVDHYMYGTPKR